MSIFTKTHKIAIGVYLLVDCICTVVRDREVAAIQQQVNQFECQLDNIRTKVTSLECQINDKPSFKQ